jgi:hypothetical protein
VPITALCAPRSGGFHPVIGQSRKRNFNSENEKAIALAGQEIIEIKEVKNRPIAIAFILILC